MSATDLQSLVPAPEATNGVAAEAHPQPSPTSAAPSADAVLDRRADVEAKTALVATLLQEVGCEGLLLVEPENFAWLTSGGTARGVLDPAQSPAVYCNGESRWIIASNVDSQRLFDEELDGLGFQLKEWPWHWGRDQFLADLCQDRKIACDRALLGAQVVDDRLRLLRRGLSSYEQACLRVVGLIVSHALEATCRNLNPGETEREVAGQISHRLLHRGVMPLHVGVAADGRSRLYRHFAFTSTQIAQHAVLTTTARKYGLTVTASRSVSFGPMDPQFRQEHNAVCRVGASYLASTWPDAVPREILLAGRRIYLISGFEHEWMACPQGNVTGREPVELLLTPRTEDLFHSGWAVTWSASAGAASSCDTFLVTDEGPQIITPTEVWPLKRIRIQGAEFVRPDVLER
jgi:Xaa-Pro dipeptidase